MTLILKPCGRGNWHSLQLLVGGRADMLLMNTRVGIELAGVRRWYWVRGVVS